MSNVAIYSRKLGFSYTLKYNMFNFRAHCAAFQQKKPFPKGYCLYGKLALNMQINTYLFIYFLLDFGLNLLC